MENKYLSFKFLKKEPWGDIYLNNNFKLTVYCPSVLAIDNLKSNKNYFRGNIKNKFEFFKLLIKVYIKKYILNGE